MFSFLRANLLSIAIFSGIILGLILPKIGLILGPYLKELLMVLMFFTSLRVTGSEFKKSIRLNMGAVLVSLVLVFFFMPLLSLTTIVFSPIILAGTILAFSCPSAIAAVFWSSVLRGNVSLGLIISIVTNLLSIVLLPIIVIVTLGTRISLDPLHIIISLMELILVPLLMATFLRRLIHNIGGKINAYGLLVSTFAVLFILWGSVALGSRYIKGNLLDFLELNLFILGLLGLALIVSYSIGKKFGEKEAVTIGISTFLKNAILSFVVGLSVFGSEVLPPLIANIIQQNLLLIPLQIILRKRSFKND